MLFFSIPLIAFYKVQPDRASTPPSDDSKFLPEPTKQLVTECNKAKETYKESLLHGILREWESPPSRDDS